MSTQTAEVMRQFDAGLAKMRSEVLKNLDGIDLLNHEEAEALVERLNQRLVVAQHDFLDFVNQLSGSSTGKVKSFKLSSAGTTVVPEAAAGVVGAGAGATLINLIPWTVPGMLWGTTTTTLATSVGTVLGVGASCATFGASILVGVAAGGALYKYRLSKRRKYVRDAILASFDEEAVPKLRVWAERVVEGMSKKVGQK